MQNIVRGFEFLKQSWQMALADRDLLKPSIYALFAGFVVTILFSIPMVLSFGLFGDSSIGRAAGYIFGAVLVFAQYTVAYIFSAMTIYLIYGYLSEGDGRMDKAWAIARRDVFDIASLAAASTVVNLVKGFIKGKGDKKGRNFLASLLDTIWTEATYLVLPAMVVEDINLGQGLRRATHIVRNNLLLVGVSTVGVKAVTGLIGVLLSGTGIIIGMGIVAVLLAQPSPTTILWIIGISVAVLIASFFILAATIISSYTATAYHTCLYLWAREVEQAQESGVSGVDVPAPAPLSAVLQPRMQPRTAK